MRLQHCRFSLSNPQTHIGRQNFEELCSVIELIQMLPDKQQLWEDLDLFGREQPHLTPLGLTYFTWHFCSASTLLGNERLPTDNSTCNIRTHRPPFSFAKAVLNLTIHFPAQIPPVESESKQTHP
jgi:hypothetical protein